MPMIACQCHWGTVHCTVGTMADNSRCRSFTTMSMPVPTAAVAKATSTAHVGANRCRTSHTTMTGTTTAGEVRSACTGAKHSGTRTPASIA